MEIIDKNYNDLLVLKKKFSQEINDLMFQKTEIINRINYLKNFFKDLEKRKQPKMSELYFALETNATTYWRIKEIKVETRAGTFIEILVLKRYFFSVEQVKIIHNHFCLKHIKNENDIRVKQFY